MCGFEENSGSQESIGDNLLNLLQSVFNKVSEELRDNIQTMEDFRSHIASVIELGDMRSCKVGRSLKEYGECFPRLRSPNTSLSLLPSHLVFEYTR